MSITARHKRPGAFKKLVQSLETTPPDRRQKIMTALASEDAELAMHAETSIFKFEEFENVPDPLLAEVLVMLKNEPRTLAMALSSTDKKLVEKFTANMTPPLRSEFKQLDGEFEKITESERRAARFRVITKARELENGGRHMLKKYSGNYPGNL